jgi:hypothetical protein
MTTPDFRALCAELIDALDSGIPAGRIRMSPLADRARAALAQPVGEPSDEDLRALASKLVKIHVGDYGYVYNVLPFARAALARWGHPTPPAPEVGELWALAAALRDPCIAPLLSERTRAATLLQQLSAHAIPLPQAGEGEV